MVIPPRLVGVGKSGRPAGGRRSVIPLGGGGVVPPHGDGHGDDQRDEAVVPGPLAVQALGEGGAPRPVGLLVREGAGSVGAIQSLAQEACKVELDHGWIKRCEFIRVSICPSGHSRYCMQQNTEMTPKGIFPTCKNALDVSRHVNK